MQLYWAWISMEDPVSFPALKMASKTSFGRQYIGVASLALTRSAIALWIRANAVRCSPSSNRSCFSRAKRHDPIGHLTN